MVQSGKVGKGYYQFTSSIFPRHISINEDDRWSLVPVYMGRRPGDDLLSGQRRRRWSNAKPALCHVLCLQGWMLIIIEIKGSNPENKRHWPNVGLMLGQRRRQRTHINLTLGQLCWGIKWNKKVKSSIFSQIWISFTQLKSATLTQHLVYSLSLTCLISGV